MTYIFIGCGLLLALGAFIASLGMSDDGRGVIPEMDTAIQRAPKQFSGAPTKRRPNVVDLKDAKERQRLAAIVQGRKGA